MWVFFLQLIILIGTQSKSVGILQSSFNFKFCGGCGQNVCDANAQRIKTLTGYDVKYNPIINNQFKIESVDFQVNSTTNIYVFPSGSKNIETSYLLVLPVMPNKQQFKGVVAYFHPTIFDKEAVPTNMDTQFLALAGLYASNGYAMVLPDYIGLGKNYKDMHPYVLFPIPNVQSMAYALDSSYNIINSTYQKSSISVFTAGYSEGGAYSLWFQLCQLKGCDFYKKMNKNFTIQKSSGMEGAYDVKGVVIPFLTSRVAKGQYLTENGMVTGLGKPGLTALAVASYATYNSKPFPMANKVLKSFFEMNCSQINQRQCNVGHDHNLTQMNISFAFQQYHLPDPHFSEAFGYSALDKELYNSKYMNYFQFCIGSNLNSVFSFIEPALLSDKQFKETVDSATIVNKTNLNLTNTFIFSLQSDSLVSPQNSLNLSQSQPNLTYQFFDNALYKVCTRDIITNVDHMKAELIANIYTLKFFNQNNSQAKQQNIKIYQNDLKLLSLRTQFEISKPYQVETEKNDNKLEKLEIRK